MKRIVIALMMMLSFGTVLAADSIIIGGWSEAKHSDTRIAHRNVGLEMDFGHNFYSQITFGKDDTKTSKTSKLIQTSLNFGKRFNLIGDSVQVGGAMSALVDSHKGGHSSTIYASPTVSIFKVVDIFYQQDIHEKENARVLIQTKFPL